MPFIVTADIRLEVDDDQAQNEEQAKVVAIEQLSDFLRDHTWLELLKAQRVEDGPEYCWLGYCRTHEIRYGGGHHPDIEAGKCPICKNPLANSPKKGGDQ